MCALYCTKSNIGLCVCDKCQLTYATYCIDTHTYYKRLLLNPPCLFPTNLLCALDFAIVSHCAHPGGCSSVGYPPPPPPSQGASDEQLVAKGAALRSQWAPKVPDAPWAPKAPEGNFCPFCTLSLNPTLTLALTLARIEYWDRASGGRNIVLETSTTNEVRTGKWLRAAQKGPKMSCIHPFGRHTWSRIIFGKP